MYNRLTMPFKDGFIESRLGALPSPFDNRNLSYMNWANLVMSEVLPDEYTELLEYAPDNFARNQGNIGSCVGWDGAYVYETQLTLLQKYMSTSQHVPLLTSYDDRKGTTRVLRLSLTDMSAGWAYQRSRENSFPPIPDHIEGSTNFGLMKALEKVGICTEALCPTDTIAPFDKPANTAEQQRIATAYRIASYHNVSPDPVSVKSAIYGLLHKLPYEMPDNSHGKSPLVAAFPVYENFKDSYDDGVVPMPSGRLLGGHSSPVFGWKLIDDKKYWVNFGSWGNIGDNGLFYIPEDYPFYGNDWWLPKILPTTEPPQPTCIWEASNWVTKFLNTGVSAPFRYYRGVPAGGEK